MLLLCNYYVTYHCNSYCSFCHFADHDKYKEFPNASLDDFKSNIDQLSGMGVKFIDLTGGEPLMNRNIAEMLAYAKKKGMQTSITTNTLLYPRYAEKIAGKVDLLHFSLDSPDPDEHNEVRGIKCHSRVFESIDIAKSLGEFPDILFTVTNETFEKLPQMYEIAQKQNLVLIVNPVFSYFGNPGLSDEALDYIEEFISGKSGIYMNSAYIKLRRDGGNDTSAPLCKAVSRVIVITPDNKIVLPCYHFGQEEVPIDRPIKEIRKTEKLKHYKKMEGRFDFCQGCTVNCYFEPSFAFPTNLYGLLSLSSKFKYGFQKLIKQKLMKKKTGKSK